MKKIIGEAGEHIDVLLVGDRPGDVRLTREAFRETNGAVRLHVACDDIEALTHQCDEAQGDYFSKPIPANMFMGVLRHGLAKTAAPRFLGSLAPIKSAGAIRDTAARSDLLV